METRTESTRSASSFKTDECISRRSALASITLSGAAAIGLSTTQVVSDQVEVNEGHRLSEKLDQILKKPVLDLSSVNQPVTVKSIELLRNGRSYLVRSRTSDGIEAITVPNPAKMDYFWPVFLKNVAPAFIGQDARRIEELLWDVYRRSSNYKLQGIALWICVAAIEMNMLELLGRAANRPVADFFGGRLRQDIPVYFASGNRGNRPEEEVEHLQGLVSGSGVKAIKFRLGGRMSRNVDSLPGRSEALIPLVREKFGNDFTLYADSNSSYDATEAIRIGRLMEEHQYGFFEEPCEFDDLWSTKKVADALAIPVAGGEQEFSMHRWKWTIANRGVDIVQPDLHYGGGLIRATQVARMAEAARMKVVPHMSGGGLGYLDVVQFASFTPNIGPFMEFKGNTSLPIHCADSSLKCEDGVVRCPSGAGFGVTIDPDFVQRADKLKP
ncbi:mandelate racemase/muconate lactonizing enzyme family protein [Thalassoglobus sp. JC818]|uniref:mandelate racemase/muconate lactonizing enzyme family protein n=1 Tax=Thalassoglobus sp. JC818 TaxID=3232136 RepID=UPI00345AE029